MATLLASLMATLRPAEARAACDCGSVSQIVRSAAERIVAGVTGLLDASIKEAATYETQNLHRDLVALREAVLMGDESVAKAIEAADAEAAERDLTKTYDLPAQPVTGCGNDAMGGELMLSKAALADAGETIMEKVVERRTRFDRPVDYLTELASFPPPGKAQALLGALSPGRTLSMEELRDAERLLEAVTDPMPLEPLPGRLAASPAGKILNAERARHEARQGLFQGVLAQRLADRAPTIEGLSDWAASKWASMGGTGDVPGLTDGRLSQEALHWLLANMRLASGNWHEEVLPRLPEAGLLREIASMMAVDLELSRKRNEHLGNISSLLALTGLAILENGPGEALRNQHARALAGER
jgi:hypothetical protein